MQSRSTVYSEVVMLAAAQVQTRSAVFVDSCENRAYCAGGLLPCRAEAGSGGVQAGAETGSAVRHPAEAAGHLRRAHPAAAGAADGSSCCRRKLSLRPRETLWVA